MKFGDVVMFCKPADAAEASERFVAHFGDRDRPFRLIVTG